MHSSFKTPILFMKKTKFEIQLRKLGYLKDYLMLAHNPMRGYLKHI